MLVKNVKKGLLNNMWELPHFLIPGDEAVEEDGENIDGGLQNLLDEIQSCYPAAHLTAGRRKMPDFCTNFLISYP